MTLADFANSLENRHTFGPEITLNDRQLRINEGAVPDRVCILGSCSNMAVRRGTTDLLFEEKQPYRISRPSELRYFRNDDPEKTPSEITLAYEDAYQSGGRSFEFVIISRTVTTLAGDVDDTATVIPVSTIYTNRVTAVSTLGAHPTANQNFSIFEHNGMVFVAGGERPDTPATGDITAVAVASLAAGDYFTFTHTDGTVYAFWYNVSGTDSRPAAVDTLVTNGATAIEIDVSGDTTADDVAITTAAAIAASDLPITPYGDDSASDEIDLESDEAGTDGNLWTLAEVVTDIGFTVTSMSGGSATHSISRRLMKWDPDTSEWSHALDGNDVPYRLSVGVRDAGAVTVDSTTYHITGGMTSIKSATDVATDNVDDVVFSGAAASDVDSGSSGAGTALNTALTNLGEALWVDAGGTIYVFGGNTGTSGTARSDMVATYNTGTGALTDTTDDLNEATRWLGGTYDSVNDLIYVFGGETSGGAIKETVIYDVNAGGWSSDTAGSMKESKYDFAYAAVANSPWVLGGTNGTDDLDTIERFDVESLTWQERDELDTAASGGRVLTIGFNLFYVDAVTGKEFNVGLGNLQDENVGFGDPATPYYIQLDWEIMQVIGHTTTKSRGKLVDAFTVVRGQKGSTAVAHKDFSDIYEDPETLFDDLDETYAKMGNNSSADFLVLPMRAVADNPYLPVGKNFAWQAAYYCYLKTKADRPTMAVVGVFPAHENPYTAPSLSNEDDWYNKLVNYSRTNFEGEEIWEIGDGTTDANGDGKPDNYAFWATSDAQIPVGSPPMDSGKIQLDEDDNQIDIGKHLFIIRSYGFGNSLEWRRKYPSANSGYLRHGAASYAGMTTTLEPSSGGTNAPSRGFTPHRTFTFVQENTLSGERYIGVVNRGSSGLRWDTDYTFAWNVSTSNRSDWVLGATFRRVAVVLRAVNDLLNRYYGEPVIGPHRNAMEGDLADIIRLMIDNNVIGPNSTYELVVDRADRILGRAKVYLNLESVGELIHVQEIVSLS